MNRIPVISIDCVECMEENDDWKPEMCKDCPVSITNQKYIYVEVSEND